MISLLCLFFVQSVNALSVVSTITVVPTVPISGPAGIAYDSAKGEMYVINANLSKRTN